MVDYIGEINEDQKGEFLGKAKALLFPIDWSEPFGIVMIEAMACGTPALIGTETAAGCPGAPILAEPTGTEDDAARWAARIESMLGEPQKLHELRAGVAAFAGLHWSWEECVARYAAILRSCAEGS